MDGFGWMVKWPLIMKPTGILEILVTVESTRTKLSVQLCGPMEAMEARIMIYFCMLHPAPLINGTRFASTIATEKI